MKTEFDTALDEVKAEVARFEKKRKAYAGVCAANEGSLWQSPERAALRRSSMDLSRALSKLRRARC